MKRFSLLAIMNVRRSRAEVEAAGSREVCASPNSMPMTMDAALQSRLQVKGRRDRVMDNNGCLGAYPGDPKPRAVPADRDPAGADRLHPTRSEPVADRPVGGRVRPEARPGHSPGEWGPVKKPCSSLLEKRTGMATILGRRKEEEEMNSDRGMMMMMD